MYNSTDFWYTFINSLYNEGLSYGRGELEMDKEMQDKFLAYLKEKIEEGITDGETTLPPGLHNYFWRFPFEMLPKTRELTDTYLKSDPKNGVAALLRTLVEISDWEAKNDPHIDESMRPIPNDPCMNLVVIDQYRMNHLFGHDIEKEVKVLGVFENFYAWAKQQDDSARYQEARSFYQQHRVTPYTVYRQLKDKLRQLQERLEDSAISEESNPEVERCKELIKKCRGLVPMENAAFRKNFGQQSEEQQDLVDATSDSTDIWEAYLKSHENRKNAPPRRLTQNDQEHLLEFLKTKIEAGVIDGKTTLPANLQEYISDFPEAMHLELREFAEEVLEVHPDNGAATKILAIIVWESKNAIDGDRESDRDLILLEQAMNLAPNDTETCFFALRKYDEDYDPFCILTLTVLERLFARSLQQNDSDLSQWLTRIYKEIGRTPCHIYRNLIKAPDANAELIERCKPLIDQMLHTFQQRLSDEPDDWYALRGLGDVYEVLGETELAQEYPWEPHAENRWEQEAWVGKQLPDFSAVAVDGTPISTSDFNGKLLVLNWCAKWCGFCKPEIPYLKKVYEEYHDKGLEVIGISLDENEAELHEFTKEHEIPWLQVYDGKGWKAELVQFFCINIIPSQWLIDRDGKIISVGTRGEQLSQLVKWTEATRIGNMIPDFAAVDVDGNPVSNVTLRGKVALLHFGYVVQEKEPELEYIDYLYTKHHRSGFEVVGFNVDGWRDEEALRDIVRRRNHQGHYIYPHRDGDHAAVDELFGCVSGNSRVTLPAFILIDPAGKVIGARYGNVHSTETWAVRLDELIWESKNVRYEESDRDIILLEQTMNLAPNDTETCFFALRKYDEDYDPFCILTLTVLERLFARSLQQNDSDLSQWLTRIYKEIGRTPCHIYRNLIKAPDANAELIERCKPLIDQMLHTFQQRLSDEPDDWYALRGLGDVYEVLGETELAQEYPWEPHAENRWEQEAWVGKQLPDFSAVAVDGTPISTSDFNGKLLVLNWCAKWCGFCKPEIPYLKKVYEEYHDKGLEVIGISLDENEAELHEFTKEHEIPWLQVYDGKGWKAELAQFFCINFIPSQWLIDRDGKIISVDTRKEQLDQLVKWTEATRIGNMIPDFTAVDVDGKSVSNVTLRGKVALLHFGYIRQEPELEHIDKLYTKHHKNGFEVVSFTVGGWRDEEALRDIVRRENYQGHYIYAHRDGDHAAVGELFGCVSGYSRKVTLPAFILIDPAGKVIDARHGNVHSTETWAVRLDQLITENL